MEVTCRDIRNGRDRRNVGRDHSPCRKIRGAEGAAYSASSAVRDDAGQTAALSGEPANVGAAGGMGANTAHGGRARRSRWPGSTSARTPVFIAAGRGRAVTYLPDADTLNYALKVLSPATERFRQATDTAADLWAQRHR